MLFIKKVTAPLIKNYKNCQKKIVDENFYWLQIGIENVNYWITAMYDNNKKIIQYYIDITSKNCINSNEETFFYDLFLDIVMLDNGELYLLDEDELKEALDEKNISINQYEFAYRKANEIMEYLSKEKSKLEYLCNKYFNLLVDKLESNK